MPISYRVPLVTTPDPPAHAPTADDRFSPEDRAVIDGFLAAYRHGAFPMAEPSVSLRGLPRRHRRIDWYIPDPRAIIAIDRPINAPGGFHIPRSLARRLRNNPFVMTSDRAFGEVIRACAAPAPGREDSWLDDRLIHAYTLLHRAGHVHSIEAWLPSDSGQPSPLVGGIYGVALGGVFCAESMFCRPESGGTDASKVCLAFLVRHLRTRAYQLLDVQIANQHTARFGVVEVTNSEYQSLLRRAIDLPCNWGCLDPFWSI
ncbi:MAG: leucyl/phenylalanyl-tRNA--protein transferase [Phycisphaerales bacterium]